MGGKLLVDVVDGSEKVKSDDVVDDVDDDADAENVDFDVPWFPNSINERSSSMKDADTKYDCCDCRL
jgi:hypothetical protein